MLTTTDRGWWPALEPALLAFAAVVCSGVSLLALSQEFASDCRHQCDTTRSSYWTVAAADQDPLDDDDDDAPDASVAVTILLTSDDGFGRLLVERELDAASKAQRAQLVPRGPPDGPRASHHSAAHLPQALRAAASPDPLQWTSTAQDSVDDGDDDGDNDDDDGVDDDDAGDAIAAQTILQTHDDSHHPVIAAEFGVALTLRAENIGARGPPVDWHSPAGPAHLTALYPDDASDVDVTDSDDDDDDSAELDRWSVAAAHGPDCLLIAANVDHLRSFASHDNSLRAPPQ
jgi:hypothetical protein